MKKQNKQFTQALENQSNKQSVNQTVNRAVIRVADEKLVTYVSFPLCSVPQRP